MTSARGNFFAVLGMLERRSAGPRVGDTVADSEPVRLRHDADLAFPTADVCAVDDTTSPPTVTSTFLGLTGSAAPLPEHITEGFCQEPDSPLHALFDVWHHRLLALLYRSVSRYSPSREAAHDAGDAWSRRLLGWSAGAASLPTWRRLRWTPWLVNGRATLSTLRQALIDLVAPHIAAEAVSIVPLTGGWQPLCTEQQTRLGARSSRLGQDFLLGAHVEARASAYTVELGPLTAEGYAFLQQIETRRDLAATLALVGPPGVDARVIAHAPGHVLPEWRCGHAALGVTSWLGRPTKAVKLPLRPACETPEVHHAS